MLTPAFRACARLGLSPRLHFPGFFREAVCTCNTSPLRLEIPGETYEMLGYSHSPSTMSVPGTGLLSNCGCPFTQLTFEQTKQLAWAEERKYLLEKQMQRNKFHFPGLRALSLVYLSALMAE